MWQVALHMNQVGGGRLSPSHARQPAVWPPGTALLQPGDVLRLQRLAGNRAVVAHLTPSSPQYKG